MSTNFQDYVHALGGSLSLQAEAFRSVSDLPNGMVYSLITVLFAGLSLAIGQSIILFINQVKPLRFIFSLLLNAVLFAFGYLFLVFSTWLICLLPSSIHMPFGTLARVFGLSYAPMLFSFLGALPYLGVPILTILSVWRLLGAVVGFATVAGIGGTFAIGYVALGWVALQVLESTIGQPIAKLGKELADRVAGVDLVNSRAELTELVSSGGRPAAALGSTTPQARLTEVRDLLQVSRGSDPAAVQAVAQAVATQPLSSGSIKVTQGIHSPDLLVQFDQKTSSIPPGVKLALSLLGMVILFGVVATLLRPLRNLWFGWYTNLPGLFQLIFDMVWIGVVALVFAGILAPLETLGWWAGWYGDEVDTTQTRSSPSLSSTSAATSNIARYVVYLDGIGQSGEEYTPDVEDFLTALKPALPKDVELVQGLMMYSVLNKPLDEDRPLAFLWKKADQMRWTNPTALLGILVNLRNVLIVAVSSDKRYGPIYNQGIAQVLYDGLVARGYEPGSGIPITLIGYSGGGEMSAASGPYLRRATGASIDVISLGGVMSANNNFLKLEHLYHIVGDKDSVERIGPVMFPGRWKLFPLSYWNRAKRRGKISIVSAGPVGHQVPGGYMDPQAMLPDGRSHLQHTIEIILKILRGDGLATQQSIPKKMSHYALYQQTDFNRPDYYPLTQTVDQTWYKPIGAWMGRLILPAKEERSQVKGVWFEIHHAGVGYEHLVGKVVKLRWIDNPKVRDLVKAVTRDVHFSADAEYTSEYGGLIHPTRLDHWQQVGPLESLAGSHPVDDLIVMLEGDVIVEDDSILRIYSTPVQITGRYYALVRFIAPVGDDRFQVVHFNPTTRQFDGLTEVVRVPQVMLAEGYGSYPSTSRNIESSPLNEMGWYIYGAKDPSGVFVVQSLGPRSLFKLQPERVIFGYKAGYRYIRNESWADIVAQKGKISSVLLCPDEVLHQVAIEDWQEGDRALVLHTYGGIGGKKKEPAAATPIFFGHFAYGLARVVRDPLAEELRFDIQYYQVYTHNTDGLVAGTLHWSKYMGDRQFGWAGTRPTCDILIKQDTFTGVFDLQSGQQSALLTMVSQLQVMTARYRIGDGTGGTYVGPANNCSQDANQALFASLQVIRRDLESRDRERLRQWLESDIEQATRFKELVKLGMSLEKKLQPLGGPRSDWEQNEYNLGSTLEDSPLRNLVMGLGSWRTLLPRLASDTIVQVFLQHHASVWVLRTNQIGGYDPDIEPIAPMTL